MAQFPEDLPPGWRKRLAEVSDQDYFKSLIRFLNSEYQSGKKIYPPRDWILRALQLVDYDEVKLVILGQDPYHGIDQAIGLSFAVPNQLVPKPPSLQNIFKEIQADLQITLPANESELTGWVKQGVLLLNTVLTVRQAQAFSHRDKGWEKFTDYVIQKLNEREKPVIFILWGAAAQKKKELIDLKRHRVLESVHPSPLSAYRGFFGCKHFSKANMILKELGQKPIAWNQICEGP